MLEMTDMDIGQRELHSGSGTNKKEENCVVVSTAEWKSLLNPLTSEKELQDLESSPSLFFILTYILCFLIISHCDFLYSNVYSMPLYVEHM